MKLRFEHVGQPLLPGFQFLKRLLISVGVGMGLIVLSLVAGMAGYHYLEDLSWIDAFLNASMILSGMGPIGTIDNDWGKLFASLYALISGVVFITTIGLILAPVAHRVFHRFHLEEDEK